MVYPETRVFRETSWGSGSQSGRYLVSITARSESKSCVGGGATAQRCSTRPGRSVYLDYGQDVSGRIFEPRDERAFSVVDAPLVLIGVVVAFEAHAAPVQLIGCLLNVLSWEVEGRQGLEVQNILT